MKRPMLGVLGHDLDDRVVDAFIVVVALDRTDDAMLSPTGGGCGAGSLHD